MQPFLTLALAATLAAPSFAQNMVAVSWTGSAYSIDSGTGAGVLLGATGFTSLNSMAKDPGTGRIYANSGATIIEIHPVTGVGTAVVTTSLSSIRGMAFLGNTLYAVQDGNPDTLYTVNLSTGASTLIGGTGYNGIQGLTATSGTLYAWEIGSGNCVGVGLVTLNPATGAATDVNAANGNQICDVQALCTAPSGAVFAVQNNVYRVDLNSGLLALVGGGGYSDVRGAEFIGTPFTLTRQGPCPGPIGLTTTNGTPNGGVALIYGNVGTFTKPSGACAGLTLGLSNPQLAAIIPAGANGSAAIGFNAPLAWCGRTVQAVDMVTCTASNTIVL
jgi:hypothetical protein